MPFGAWRFKSSHPHRRSPDRLAGGARSRIPVPSQRADVLGAPARAARRRRPARPRPARRAGALPPGRRDRRRPGDRLGNAGAPVVRAADPDRRARAVSRRTARSSSSRGAAASPRSRPGGAGRSAATAAAAPRSTASGSTSARTSDRPGSRASASTARPPAAGACRRSSSCRIRRARRRRSPWPLRATDIDLHGHVNNAVYWQAVEHVLAVGRRRSWRGRSSPSSTTASRSTSATRSSSSRRARRAELIVGLRASGRRSGPWRGWTVDSVAPGGASSPPCRARPACG